MNITTTTPKTAVQIIMGKKKAISDELAQYHADSTDDKKPPVSEELESVLALSMLSEVYVITGFAGCSDMEIAAKFVEGQAKNSRLVHMIIVQSADFRYKVDADLDTMEKLQKSSFALHTVELDSTDPDQTPLVVFGVLPPEMAYRHSPDYAVDIVNAAQAKARAKQAAEAKAESTARNDPFPVFRSMWVA